MDPIPPAILILTITLLTLCLRFIHKSPTHQPAKHQPPLPPGPPKLPLLGNLHQIPRDQPWKTYKRWADIYGPLMSVQLAGTTTVVFSSWDLIKTHVERRNTIYSSRPSVPFFLHATGGLNASILPYGPEWKLQRSIRASVLKPSMTIQYRGVQDRETAQLVHELLATNDFSTCLRRCIASVFLAVAYGERCVGKNNSNDSGSRDALQAIDRLEDLNRAIATHAEALFSGTTAAVIMQLGVVRALVERLPPRWKKEADILHDKLTADLVGRATAALARPGWNWVKEFQTKEGIAAGQGEGAGAGDHERNDFRFKRLAYMVGSLYEASMAASQALRVIILAGLLHRDAVRRMQDELDAVVGTSRLPDYTDADHLPWTQAFIKEAMRWRTLTPMGSPRATSSDDECRGYRIPRGATVLVNVWAMNHDETVFPDPFAFQPQRWIDDPDLPQILYGIGQRACPGRHMGQDSLFLGTARLFWAFDMVRPPGAGEMDPERFLDGAGGETLASFVPDFEVLFTPRSELHRRVIEERWDVLSEHKL